MRGGRRPENERCGLYTGRGPCPSFRVDFGWLIFGQMPGRGFDYFSDAGPTWYFSRFQVASKKKSLAHGFLDSFFSGPTIRPRSFCSEERRPFYWKKKKAGKAGGPPLEAARSAGARGLSKSSSLPSCPCRCYGPIIRSVRLLLFRQLLLDLPSPLKPDQRKE
jgi:hypothetical protein